ncbi:hypothetical protein K505DRAFT_293566 [Melanomma pulvis-pyrius CBS 109.77]|uniref:glucan endo-1,3-beta-D-glucosidase n=1 Tax=Melanomma pulvis-pyrius CBS 109.77 TaxID=1314802 RepID=A0A6A6XUY8_9PLEO|nr:hypothetical protein K505DRAFT_293566 [Melanomma pulvis-pyrius CBS 109.77]
MQYLILRAAVTALLSPLAVGKTAGQLCRGTSQKADDGNWYCSEVQTITYRNISQSGAYNRTISVDPDTGRCAHETITYPGTGTLTPLLGELSMHLRGPMNVSQLAVYVIADGQLSARTVPYGKKKGLKRQTYGSYLPPNVADCECSTVTTTSTVTNTDCGQSMSELPTLPTCPCRSTHETTTTTADTWSRVAYYTSAAPAQATGFAFLANLGDPQKSGTFDYSFGNSLAYVSKDGGKVASQYTPFDDCEYARPMSTAYHGWSGESKAFFIEFQMDHYDNVGSDQGMLSDAPAWWFLNAAIPRVLQYGNDRDNIPCSCWSTGCGEFDAFEVLGRGEERAKSTIHRQGNLEGGDSNYFVRPVGRTMKFAVVFWQYNITATILDDGFVFGEGLEGDVLREIVSYDPDSSTHSLFAIGT